MHPKRTQPPRKTTQNAAKSGPIGQKRKECNKRNADDVSSISTSPEIQSSEDSNKITRSKKSSKEKKSTDKLDQVDDSMDNAPLAGRINTNASEPPSITINLINESDQEQDESSDSNQEEPNTPQSTNINEHDEILFSTARPTTITDILFTNEDMNPTTNTNNNTSTQNTVTIKDLYDPVDDPTSIMEPPIKDPFQFDFTNIPIVNHLRPPTVILPKSHQTGPKRN
ncbi:unnamed protein product [Adineta ricciae]|uniref:Uncharacterized protein n=1 Tax=Adineta ricciae TaxID=249248 RepID=A0A815QAF2_ADIRI|nr:unnamed protein product [Adineta ricciae]CAF1666790.1 unnamed protein product [Adineta ricciae]